MTVPTRRRPRTGSGRALWTQVTRTCGAQHQGCRGRAEPPAQPAPSAWRMGSSFASDSASSAAGFEAATMPQPAKSRRRWGSSGSSSADRSAMPHSPSPSAPSQPDRTGVPAPVHALDLRDERPGGRGRRPAHGGGRVQRRGERQAGRPGPGAAPPPPAGKARGCASTPGDVAGQVQDVRQVQDERDVGHVGRRAERRERVGDRAHRVLVLLEVLGRVGEDRRPGEVGVVVAGAADGAGQDARGDQALLAADQQLGRRAEDPVDAERPARRVGVGQAAEDPPRVERLGSCEPRRRARARPSRPARTGSPRPPARRRRATPSAGTAPSE